jgi:uncharacterized membrane protein YfcA
MTNPPQTNSRGSRGRRKLNQPLIKSLIVLAAAAGAAAGSAITGIGAHLGFAPMVTWMFGYAPEKAQGVALRFTLVAALTTIITYLVLQDHAAVHISRGLLLVIGATIGAIIAAPVTPPSHAIGARRALQAIAIVVAIFTITESAHLTALTRSETHYAHWSAWWQLLLLAIVGGAVTQAARLTGGTLLVPSLFFLTAVPDRIAATGLRPLTAAEAVIEALIVVFVASLLPAWGYTQRRIADSTYAMPTTIGAIVGGAFGGWILPLLLERSILVAFGIVAMFFAAREIARLATEPSTPPPAEPPDP